MNLATWEPIAYTWTLVEASQESFLALLDLKVKRDARYGNFQNGASMTTRGVLGIVLHIRQLKHTSKHATVRQPGELRDTLSRADTLGIKSAVDVEWLDGLVRQRQSPAAREERPLGSEVGVGQGLVGRPFPKEQIGMEQGKDSSVRGEPVLWSSQSVIEGQGARSRVLREAALRREQWARTCSLGAGLNPEILQPIRTNYVVLPIPSPACHWHDGL